MTQIPASLSLTSLTQPSSDEEKYLQALVLEIQVAEETSIPQKTRQLNQLLRSISQSTLLRGEGDYGSDIYNDALNRTLYWVVTHLADYDPEKGCFMSWVNYRLQKYLGEVQQEMIEPVTQKNYAQIIRRKHKLATLVNKVGKQGLPSYLLGMAHHSVFCWIVLLNYCYLLKQSQPNMIDALLQGMAEASVTRIPLQRINSGLLEKLQSPVHCSSYSLIELMRSYVELDPDNLLKVTPRKHPHVTFQQIFLARLNAQDWREIAHRYQMNVSSLRTFFQRNLDKFSGQIRQFVEAQPEFN
ncbi:MAG: hypothetical protein AB4041_12740 [Microcystaceae cyanobacterium]